MLNLVKLLKHYEVISLEFTIHSRKRILIGLFINRMCDDKKNLSQKNENCIFYRRTQRHKVFSCVGRLNKSLLNKKKKKKQLRFFGQNLLLCHIPVSSFLLFREIFQCRVY